MFEDELQPHQVSPTNQYINAEPAISANFENFLSSSLLILIGMAVGQNCYHHILLLVISIMFMVRKEKL